MRSDNHPPGNDPDDRTDPFTRANAAMLFGGIVLLVAGFALLSLADARAENAAGRLAPLLILGAYGLILAGLVRRPRSKPNRKPMGRRPEADQN